MFAAMLGNNAGQITAQNTNRNTTEDEGENTIKFYSGLYPQSVQLTSVSLEFLVPAGRKAVVPLHRLLTSEDMAKAKDPRSGRIRPKTKLLSHRPLQSLSPVQDQLQREINPRVVSVTNHLPVEPSSIVITAVATSGSL